MMLSKCSLSTTILLVVLIEGFLILQFGYALLLPYHRQHRSGSTSSSCIRGGSSYLKPGFQFQYESNNNYRHPLAVVVLHQRKGDGNHDGDSEDRGEDSSLTPANYEYYNLQNNQYDYNRKINRQWLIDRFQFPNERLNQNGNIYGFLTLDNSILESRVNWLQKALGGLSNEETTKIIQQCPIILSCRTDSNLGPTISCLKSNLELERNALRRIVLKNAGILLSKENDIETKVELLQRKLGLDLPALNGIIRKEPRVLFGANLEQNLSWLQKRLDLSDPQLRKMIKRCPVLLRLSVTKNLEPKLNWLVQQLNLNDDQTRRMIQKRPSILNFSVPNKLEPNLKWIKQRLRLSDSQITKMLVRAPQILTDSISRKMEVNLEWIQERLSPAESELSNIIFRQPSILFFNITTNLKPKIDFYVNSIETDEDVISWLVKDPVLLTFALEKRLEPRCAEAKKVGLRINTTMLRKIARLTDAKWASEIQKRSQ